MYCLNHRGGSPKWLPGVISSVQGPVTVLVTLEDGKESRYHIDHIRSRNDDATDGRKETIMSQKQDVEDVGPLILTCFQFQRSSHQHHPWLMLSFYHPSLILGRTLITDLYWVLYLQLSYDGLPDLT